MVRILAVLVLVFALGTPAWAGPSYPQIFGSAETPSQNLKIFTKWTGVLDRHAIEQKLEDTPCTEGPFNKCFLQKWKRQLGQYQSLSLPEKLRAVNSFANHAAYITDPVNYGMADYWATPQQ